MGLQFFWGCPRTPWKLHTDPPGFMDHRLKTPELVDINKQSNGPVYIHDGAGGSSVGQT